MMRVDTKRQVCTQNDCGGSGVSGGAARRLLPWPCAAVAAARAAVADRGSSQRPGPPEVSASHNTLCRGPPCICAESGGNPPCPAGEKRRNKKRNKCKR